MASGRDRKQQLFCTIIPSDLIWSDLMYAPTCSSMAWTMPIGGLMFWISYLQGRACRSYREISRVIRVKHDLRCFSGSRRRPISPPIAIFPKPKGPLALTPEAREAPVIGRCVDGGHDVGVQSLPLLERLKWQWNGNVSGSVSVAVTV